MTPAKMSSSGRSAPRLISIGRSEVVERNDDQAPHQQRGRPAGIATPVHPADGGQQHQHRPDLGDTEHQHQRRQQRRKRHTGDRETDTTEHSSNDGGDTHTERDPANGLTGEDDRVFATGSASRRPKRNTSRPALSPSAYMMAAMVTTSTNWISMPPSPPT